MKLECYHNRQRIWETGINKTNRKIEINVKLCNKNLRFKLTHYKPEDRYLLVWNSEKYCFDVDQNKVLLLDSCGEVVESYSCSENVILGSLEILPVLFEKAIDFYRQNGEGYFSIFDPLKGEESPGFIKKNGEIKDRSLEIYFLNLKKRGYNILYDPEMGILYANDPFAFIEICRNDLDKQIMKELLKEYFLTPLPANVVEKTLKAGECLGKLVRPSNDSITDRPAVLLLSGAGYLDCEGNSHDLLWDTLKELGYYLGHNTVTYRYTDRKPGPDVGITELFSDAERAYFTLRNQPEVDPEKIQIIGHSQGAILAGMLAAKYSEIKQIILLSPQGKPTEQFFFEQYTDFHPDQNQKVMANLKEFYEMLKSGQVTNPDNHFYQLYQGEWKRYKELVDLDIYHLYSQIKGKIYILHGGEDFQVPPEHTELLWEVLADRGCKVFKKIFPGLDHLFMKKELGGTGDYSNYKRRMDPEFKAELARIVLTEGIE